MAKRFTATEKWDDPFFAELSNENKLIWIFLLDKCNHAGIWDVNKRLLEFSLGVKVDMDKLLADFSGRIRVLESGKWFIKKFIDFQYGELKDNNNTHNSVKTILQKEGVIKPLSSPSIGDQDTDKDKDKEKDKEEPIGQKFKLEQCVQIVLLDKEWVMNAKPTKEQLDSFQKHLLCSGEYEKNPAEFKKHFNNWRNKQKPEEKGLIIKPLKA